MCHFHMTPNMESLHETLLSSYLKNYSANFLVVLGLLHHTYCRLSIDIFTFGKRSKKSTLMSTSERKYLRQMHEQKRECI